MNTLPLFSVDYLKSIWTNKFEEYKESGLDEILKERLIAWSKRDKKQSETQAEQGLINRFFVETWGYWDSGSRNAEKLYNLYPQFKIDKSGQQGGTGSADLALGNFNPEEKKYIPQVLCEFKDIKSSLDAHQNRQGNNRSPVKQCFDYLKYAFDATDSNSTVTPTWGIVTDMNEFRLYSRKHGMGCFQQFFIGKSSTKITTSLTENNEKAAFQRFVFTKIFSQTMLLAEHGKSSLEKILEDQRIHEKNLEKEFYKEYQAYREFLFNSIREANINDFEGTPGKMVQLTQRLLDRCIFILFCEDMGSSLNFPTNLLRNILSDQSRQEYFDPDHDNIWSLIKQLFRSMKDGGTFTSKYKIPHFNGGLFAKLPELENLIIPNKVFCFKGQGESVDALMKDKKTLLYFSAKYNFGASDESGERTISLYTLGRIFEQSITDLEYMESEADGTISVAQLNKRKRNGVYYTPEWVTEYIVRETIGEWLADRRKELDLEIGSEFSEKHLNDYRAYLTGTRKNKKRPRNEVSIYLDKLRAYRTVIEELKVLDPSCGSGAFLIQALNYLLSIRTQVASEIQRIEQVHSLFDIDTTIRDILSKNIYGVDLNPESVEITQLALWLNTAVPGKPLSKLDQHILNGNSLVGPDFIEFYNGRNQKQANLFGELPEQEKEKINVFDWEKAFPEVFGADIPDDQKGFDCIIGNPPYVKLQNFRKVKPDESDYFIHQKNHEGNPLYQSSQTGNYDLYLLFIEKGLGLLNNNGRLGYIAPSVWLKNEYGRGLRQLIKKNGSMDRWVDFKSFQVFEEATTYCALQFFTSLKNTLIKFSNTEDGDITSLNWEQYSNKKLSNSATWDFIPSAERELIEKLSHSYPKLEKCCSKIAVGIQATKNSIYILEKISSNSYCQNQNTSSQHTIEDKIMHPLVSGPEAKRYQIPGKNNYILFPYKVISGEALLMSPEEIQTTYPNAWKYFSSNEKEIRECWKGKDNVDQKWWGYVYPKNLSRQHAPKLCVAQTVQKLEVFFDAEGNYCLNNVRVNGIIVDSKLEGWFLLGVINSPVPDFIFRRISTPKANGYYEANKQYIAPLPIPKADETQKEQVANLAEKLQELTTKRRDTLETIQCRFEGSHCILEKQNEDFFWADVKPLQTFENEAPGDMPARKKTIWAKEQKEAALNSHLDLIDSLLSPQANLIVKNDSGEVSLTINGIVVISAFPETGANFLEAQWRQYLRTTNITEKYKAKTLVKQLLAIKTTENTAFEKNVLALDEDIISLDDEIESLEKQLNKIVYGLYRLTEDEIKLVEAG